MTQNGTERSKVTATHAILMVTIFLVFVAFVAYLASGKDWFGEYEKPITTGAPMLVTQDEALLIILPGSTYYKFPNKAPQVAEPVVPVVPAVVLPTAISPKAQP